jgi:exopolysaccharide biosynthesis polyprenyl glycosylphosphotransferase
MLSQLLRRPDEEAIRPGAGRLSTVVQAEPVYDATTLASSQRRDALFRRSLAAADCVALLSSLLVVVACFDSVRLRFGAVVTLPLVILAGKLLGLYDRDETLLHKTTLEEMPRLFHLATLSALGIWLAHDVVFGGPFAPATALVLWSALTVSLPVLRVLARRACLHLAAPERCLVIGDPFIHNTLRKRLTGRPGVKAEIVGYLDLTEARPTGDGEFADRLLRISNRVTEAGAQRVIVAPGGSDGEEVLDLMRTLRAIGIRVSFVPRVLEVLGTSVEFDDVHGITVMGARRFQLSRSSALLKRTFDLLVASLLLLLLAPAMALAALAIRLESPGGVFFRQVRVGRRGTRFDMLKFRTMVMNAEALKSGLRELNEAEAGFFKITNDPRVTRVGRLLRRTSLDELPQLINVLRGEMSLVGPRPLVSEEDQQILGWSRRRLDLTPGMTGHWQILGSSRVPLPEMVAIDCVYVTTWSLWTDVKILLRTVPHVLGLRGR